MDIKNIENIIVKIEDAQTNIEENKSKLEKLKWEQGSILQKLEKEFKVKSIEEASKLLSKKEAELIDRSDVLEELTEKLDILMEN